MHGQRDVGARRFHRTERRHPGLAREQSQLSRSRLAARRHGDPCGYAQRIGLSDPRLDDAFWRRQFLSDVAARARHQLLPWLAKALGKPDARLSASGRAEFPSRTGGAGGLSPASAKFGQLRGPVPFGVAARTGQGLARYGRTRCCPGRARSPNSIAKCSLPCGRRHKPLRAVAGPGRPAAARLFRHASGQDAASWLAPDATVPQNREVESLGSVPLDDRAAYSPALRLAALRLVACTGRCADPGGQRRGGAGRRRSARRRQPGEPADRSAASAVEADPAARHRRSGRARKAAEPRLRRRAGHECAAAGSRSARRPPRGERRHPAPFARDRVLAAQISSPATALSQGARSGCIHANSN